MTPTPPPNYRIIPREYLEAGNPLPSDALFFGEQSGKWLPCPGAGDIAGEGNWGTPHATAQPLPCFAPPPNEEEQPCPQCARLSARLEEVEREFAEATKSGSYCRVNKDYWFQLRVELSTARQQLEGVGEERDRLRRENEEMANALESNEKALANVTEQLAACEKDRGEQSSAMRVGLQLIQSRTNKAGCVTSDLWHIAGHALSPAAADSQGTEGKV